MPNKPRFFVSGGIYHVYCKTHRSEARFDRHVESSAFTCVASEVAASHGLAILGWALMSNHYHLVVRTGDVMLWRSMAGIQLRVTREHNRRRAVAGPGWQSRYRARLILDDRDLRHLLAYVHLNPVVAGLVEDPADYELSGHRSLIGQAAPGLVDVSAALRCFGEESLGDARKAYLDCVRNVAEARWARCAVRHLPWWKPVGDDYQTVDGERAPGAARTFDGLHPDLPPAPAEDLEVLLTRACRLFGIAPSALSGGGKSVAISVARRRFVFVATCHFQHSGVAVARLLRKSPGQVSRWLSHEIAACSGGGSEAAVVNGILRRLVEPGRCERG